MTGPRSPVFCESARPPWYSLTELDSAATGDARAVDAELPPGDVAEEGLVGLVGRDPRDGRVDRSPRGRCGTKTGFRETTSELVATDSTFESARGMNPSAWCVLASVFVTNIPSARSKPVKVASGVEGVLRTSTST